MKHRLFATLLAVISVVGLVNPTAAQTRRPLLIDGTSTVFQRVLTRPGAVLRSAPSGAEVRHYPAFQPLYVFANDGGWLEVGPSALAAPEGWVAAPTVVEWKQNIVAAFTNPSNRQRSLFFANEDKLRWLMEHEAYRELQPQLLKKADEGLLAPEDEIVSVEPENYVDVQDELYIMPILDFIEELHPVNSDDNLLMKLASVPLDDALPTAEGAAGSVSGDFDAGVVFVLDTTQSMEPYIDRTQKALTRIVNDINGTDIGSRINFGVIGFRDNVEAAPGLEYRTKILMPLERREDQTPLLDAIAEATDVAKVNSPGFNEDSLAGVQDAIDEIDWDQGGVDPFDGRYIILVTDAGPKDPRDPNARSEIGAVEVQHDAEGRRIVIMTLHLKTPAGGEANHDYAAERYRELSRFGQRQFYYPIEGGSEDAFESTVSLLVTALTDHVRIVRGESTVLSEDEAGSDLVDLGRAMRLAYLGAREGTRAPSVIEGWVSQQAIEDPRIRAIEPRLLVTKNEMSTMAELLDNLVRLGEASRDEADSQDFFRKLQDVIIAMAQNPDTIVRTDSATLGGALEYLERLPYRSAILQLDAESWGQSAIKRRSTLDGMRSKLTLYRKWLYDSSVWTSLYDGAPDGELVFAMPFDVLP
ncbi:MAG: VWA domain-containing protein [Rhodobacteraceae bacterium]|nr:VWA domain-containing protein [Paracoccaceae bacterium]